MTRRPDPFSRVKLEDALRDAGCPESFIATTISNYRLFVPLLFAELGEEQVFQLVDRARIDLGLGEQESAWRSSVHYLVTWAEEAITHYKTLRANCPAEETSVPEQQPRLL
jgi:hypothetical protein